MDFRYVDCKCKLLIQMQMEVQTVIASCTLKCNQMSQVVIPDTNRSLQVVNASCTVYVVNTDSKEDIAGRL